MMAEIQTFLIAMTPIGELRISIPLALEVYHLPVWLAFLISIIGNLIPAIFLLLFLGKISNYLSHQFYFFNRFFTWLFERTKKSQAKKFEKWKEFGLIILVAVPLPFTGVWTGSIYAVLFGIPFKTALLLMAIGVILAGLIVTSITLGILNIKIII